MNKFEGVYEITSSDAVMILPKQDTLTEVIKQLSEQIKELQKGKYAGWEMQ